jgi:hypothetical protein
MAWVANHSVVGGGGGGSSSSSSSSSVMHADRVIMREMEFRISVPKVGFVCAK